ncbi:MAG: ABC transporter ATP-binding protein [Candidatus Neomarinimicrobiota bacterium]|nr:ABC transporter ATP-binding protein [Candidatus Neomarinimicrobiota bacterium]
MNNLLQIQNLCVDFLTEEGHFRAVDNVSFSIEKNEIFGLVGESGSGKSTIVKSILRILPAPGIISNGKIIYKNENILSLDEQSMDHLRWKTISIVKQKALNSLNPLLKIKKQITDTITAHEKIEQNELDNRCNNLIDMVGIDREYLNSYPHELSGGMRQRVVIAIALALKPNLIIMDEPTTALDVVIEKDIILKILELKEKLGFSILFITHDLELILEFSDRIGVMKNGVIKELNNTKVIKSGGTHKYTKILINSIPKIENHIKTKRNKIKKESPLIQVSNLTKIYNKQSTFFSSKGFKALNNISFNLNENEIIGLVGESGSGKSTIAKILTKLITYEDGLITFNDINIKNITTKNRILDFRKKIQMVFQDPFASLNSFHTVFNHLSRSIIIHKSLPKSKKERKRAVYEEILKKLTEVGLTPAEQFVYKYPHEMSGGERQRISLARALIANPKVIVADEPTSMLDMSIRMEILNLFKKLNQIKNISIIFITHDIASACHLSDRIIILKNGKIVEKGTPKEIINEPKHEYSKLLINSCQPGWFTQQ